MRSKCTSRWLALALIGGASLTIALVDASRPASAFGRDGDIGEPIHERITRNAYPFMNDSVLKTIMAGNLDEDQGYPEDIPERHAVSCEFRKGAEYANMRYRQVVVALREPVASDPNEAARLFGHILHGVQDFYAHSNWIPTPPEGLGVRGRLIDTGLGLWAVHEPYSILFDDVVLVEGDPPAGVGVRLPADDNGKISSAVPIVEDRRIFGGPVVGGAVHKSVAGMGAVAGVRRYRGLITAGAPRDPGNRFHSCPPVNVNCDIHTPENVCLRHEEGRSSDAQEKTFDEPGHLNLDYGGDGDWFEARHHAKRQTQHEWCRLLHLSRDLDPSFVASGRLLGNWVEKDTTESTPHIPGTQCARGAARKHLVEISATPDRNAPRDVPFVVFRTDFTSSARATVARETKKTLKICGDTNEQIVAALVPALTSGSTLVITVPETERSWSVRNHKGGFGVSYMIKVTPNAC